jgi:hypothetical protein
VVNDHFIHPPNLGEILHQLHTGLCTGLDTGGRYVTPPEGVTDGVEKRETYDDFRKGRLTACADVVLFTKCPDGEWRVLLSLRKADKPMGNIWWVYGGAPNSYADLRTFLTKQTEKECNCAPTIRAVVATAYTCAPDHIASTIQPCYLATIPYELVGKVATDSNHAAVRLFALDDYYLLPAASRHWYVEEVAAACFRAIGVWELP